MSAKVYELKPREPGRAAKPAPPRLWLGKQYVIEAEPGSVPAATHGLVGEYRIDSERAEVLPVTWHDGRGRGFFWDADASLPSGARVVDPETDQPLAEHALRGTAVDVIGSTLEGPELTEADGATHLTLSLAFELDFDCGCHEAQLGVIHLVQAQRFLMLGDGERVTLLDTAEHDGPVLYLANHHDEPVQPVVDRQAAGVRAAHVYEFRAGQPIPEFLDDRKVESVTVLEHYSSYFMQRATGGQAAAVIWTPACPPVAWGWSIRVERRVDGSWCIARRKVMLPIGGHNGLELPVWSGNTLACVT